MVHLGPWFRDAFTISINHQVVHLDPFGNPWFWENTNENWHIPLLHLYVVVDVLWDCGLDTHERCVFCNERKRFHCGCDSCVFITSMPRATCLLAVFCWSLPALQRWQRLRQRPAVTLQEACWQQPRLSIVYQLHDYVCDLSCLYFKEVTDDDLLF